MQQRLALLRMRSITSHSSAQRTRITVSQPSIQLHHLAR